MRINRVFKKIFIQATVFLSVFFITDFIYSFAKNKSDAEKVDPNAGLHKQNRFGFYWLDSNVNKGKYTFGSIKFPIYTNEYGFRCSQKNAETKDSIDYVFLGDSFTYGEGDWNETFVGIFENRVKANIFNCGTPSYSPSVYLYQYKKALCTNRLKKGHRIFVCLDMSDIQDESTRWEYPIPKIGNYDNNGIEFPVLMPEALSRKKNEEALELLQKGQKKRNIKTFVSDNLRLTSFIYVFIKKILFKKEILNKEQSIFLANKTLNRSGITHINWSILDTARLYGYQPLGVQKGLEKVEKNLNEIIKIAKDYQGRVSLVIYPWPAQLLVAQTVFNWEKYWEKFSKENNIMFINCFDIFKNKIKSGVNPQSFYIKGDIHFNEFGNRLMAEQLIKSLN